MFSRLFKAPLGQRMVLWGTVLGVALSLYAGHEMFLSRKLERISAELAASSHALVRVEEASSAFEAVHETFDHRGVGPLDPSRIDVMVRTMVEIAAEAQGDVRQLALKAEKLFVEARRLAESDGAEAMRLLKQWPSLHEDLHLALNAALLAVSGRLQNTLEEAELVEMLLGGIGIVVLLSIVALEYRWLVRPILAMARGLRDDGESTDWLAAPAKRGDEIGMLARALLAHMRAQNAGKEAAVSRMAALASEVEKRELEQAQAITFQDEIAGIATALEAHARDMSCAAHQLGEMSGEVDRRASAAAQSTQRVAAHVGDVAATIGDITALLRTTAGEAQRSTQISLGAKVLVGEARNDSRVLQEAVGTISGIIDVISTVANQTNLLALNATIEAARAGESGRGFAVVASEVKQLAHRTAQATSSVQQGLDSIRVAAERITARVADLVVSIDHVEVAADSIAELTHRQEASSSSIADTTAATAHDVRLVAREVEQVAGMVEQSRRTAEAATQASTDLDRQAAHLRGVVDDFISHSRQIRGCAGA